MLGALNSIVTKEAWFTLFRKYEIFWCELYNDMANTGYMNEVKPFSCFAATY